MKATLTKTSAKRGVPCLIQKELLLYSSQARVVSDRSLIYINYNNLINIGGSYDTQPHSQEENKDYMTIHSNRQLIISLTEPC